MLIVVWGYILRKERMMAVSLTPMPVGLGGVTQLPTTKYGPFVTNCFHHTTMSINYAWRLVLLGKYYCLRACSSLRNPFLYEGEYSWMCAIGSWSRARGGWSIWGLVIRWVSNLKKNPGSGIVYPLLGSSLVYNPTEGGTLRPVSVRKRFMRLSSPLSCLWIRASHWNRAFLAVKALSSITMFQYL